MRADTSKQEVAMRIGSTFLAVAGIALFVVLASSQARAPTRSGAGHQAFAGPPKVQTMYGHIRSLVRRGARYELRFDPALWLGGVTAQRAAEADGAIGPGEPVPNDYYIRDEGRRALTFLVPASARATVLTSTGGIQSTRVPISELAQIVRGKNPNRRKLYDRANGLGYWIRYTTDTVRTLDQQYQP
jgi:hypothetical protein